MEDRGSWQATQSMGSGLHTCAKWLQSCPTLCNAMDCSLPGSSVHGILHTRILEWVAISSSWGSSQELNLCLISPALADVFFTTSATGKSPGLSTHTHCINKVDKEVMPCPNVCICLQGLQCTLWLRFSEDRWLGLPPLRGFPFLIPLADPPSPSSNTQITSLAQSSRVIITLYLP